MFEQADIARHQCGRRKAKHLPEWKIPRHNRQHSTQRLKSHPTSTAFHIDVSVREKSLGVVGVVAAGRRAFLCLGDSSLDGLPHLERHQATELAALRIENSCGLAHATRAIGEGSPPVLLVCSQSPIKRLVDARG